MNYWKTFVHSALNISRGDKGALTFYGDTPNVHRMIADQLCSEEQIRVSTNERTVNEWRLKNNRPDNHLFDCVVGCFCAASVCGAQVLVEKKLPKQEEQKTTQQQLQPKRSFNFVF